MFVKKNMRFGSKWITFATIFHIDAPTFVSKTDSLSAGRAVGKFISCVADIGSHTCKGRGVPLSNTVFHERWVLTGNNYNRE